MRPFAKEDGSRIKSGMTKKPSHWVIPFLRGLERTGEVRAAALDAGIDHSTAYARRRKLPSPGSAGVDQRAGLSAQAAEDRAIRAGQGSRRNAERISRARV
jgi:hypothetical protein